MAKGPNRPRGQHHVPCMLQSAWATPGKGRYPQVHVFDKHKDRAFRTAPDNVLQERDFNTYDDGKYLVCMEGGLGTIEDQTAPVLKRVIAERSLAALTLEDRVKLMTFAALQKVRGVSTRVNMIDVAEKMRDRLRAEGHDPEQIPQLRGTDDPEKVKLTAMMLASDGLPEFTMSFADKIMILVSAAPGTTFLLGDNPVVLANQNDMWPRSSLGLKVKGIQIYMPISPDLAIGFWCPSLVEELEVGLHRSQASLNKGAPIALLGVGPEAEKFRAMHADLKTRVEYLRETVRAVRDQRPLSSGPENMDYYNSLQVAYAERHVISSTGDFTLVKSMIAGDEKLRRGTRMELA